MSIVKITKHGQVTIPKRFREVLELEEGDLAEAELEGERIVITSKRLIYDKHWIQTLCGKYRDVLMLTGQYFREKQEEI